VVNITQRGAVNVPFPHLQRLEGGAHSLTQAARMLLGPQGTSVFGVYAGVDTGDAV
jgi:hypothetical protein